MGHSTGGLTLALRSSRHPGRSRARALVLNSPWLEMQGTTGVRLMASPQDIRGAAAREMFRWLRTYALSG